MPRLSDLRGVAAFALAVAAIVYAWQSIESRPIDSAAAPATTTTSTTTTVPITTTTDPAAAVARTCDRAEVFAAEAALVPADAGPGRLARLALSFWSDLELIAIDSAQAEIGAVVTYYQSFLDTAEPFEFDPVRIILEGDKEKYELLVTRPAPGLEASRAMVSFLCGIEVPDQPSMSARSFSDLEDRLLDPPDR